MLDTRRLLHLVMLVIGGLLLSQPAGAASTERVSVSSAEAQANSDTDAGESGMVSADGRFVVFSSDADNLVANDTNTQEDIFVRDRLTGTTERVSVDSAEIEADAFSDDATISANGRFVAFQSPANNLVAGDTNGTNDIFVRDLQTGTTERVSVNSAEVETFSPSANPSLSADGRFVAFESGATNLVPGDTNNSDDVFVRDRLTGNTQPQSLNQRRWPVRRIPVHRRLGCDRRQWQ